MLQSEAQVVGSEDAIPSDLNVAHLLSQIKFLHGEVERLEAQLGQVRNNAFKQSKEAARQYENVIEQKNAELNEWRSRSGFLRADADLSKRCSALEKQLALANSEKSVIAMEKSDIQAKVRALESQLKTKKSEIQEAVKSSAETVATHQERVAKLSTALKKLADENATLKSRLQEVTTKGEEKPPSVETGTEMANVCLSVSTQTAEPAQRQTHTAECQVDTVPRFANADNQSIHAVCEALEKKTQECDEYRARLDDLQAVQEETSRLLESAKRRLVEEVERRKLVSDDSEKLAIQVKSLQRKTSVQAAAERELSEKNQYLEEQRQQLRVQAMAAERERAEVESQLRQYEKDMEQLSSNKNYSNQQLSMLANENENLRAEVQKLLVRESQLSFSLKAKDGELAEVLEAYQNAVKETDTVLENQRFLERELDNARATLASKEEGVIFLQEQLNGLHKREQQLVVDLQSIEYENDQLHRKLIQSDDRVGQLEGTCQELQQSLLSRDQVVEEMHQSLAELSKQVVIKENESMLLRRRCDTLESDVAQLRSVASSETARNRDLEEANARLVTRDVLSSYNNNSNESVSKELETVKAQLTVFKSNINILTERLRTEEGKRRSLEDELTQARNKLSAANESKERLEKIVLDQTRALSTLSQ